MSRRRSAAILLAMLSAGARPLLAQTDYYNTDSGRPVSIQDAYPVERHAFELQLAPIRLERAPGGVYGWDFEPELAYGIFARTQLEIGFPIRVSDPEVHGDGRGLAGIEVAALHNLNVETETLPALALEFSTVLPVGALAPDDPYASITAIATRTLGFARFHLNGRWTFGPGPMLSAPGADMSEIAPLPGPADAGDPAGTEGLSRWLAGVAVDRTFPLRSALLIGALFVEQPLSPDDDAQWTAEAGLRYQWDPKLAIDAGFGRKLTGDDRSWSITFGAAYAFAVRSLMPGN